MTTSTTRTTTTTAHPMTVLFDPNCPMCRWLKRWVADKPQLVPLTFIAAGSAEARARFPTLDALTTVQELHVVDDAGAVYAGESAYIAVLWALEDYRELSYRISSGLLRGVAKRALALLSKYRPRDVHGLASCETCAAGGHVQGTRACDDESWGAE